MGDAKHTPGAEYCPQGYCPKPWVATVDGKTLFDARGGARRYASEVSALKAARAAALAKADGR